MISTDKRARAVCEAMARHEGVAWVGMVLRGGRREGQGEVVGYAFVRRIGSLGSYDNRPGWWCVYLGVRPKIVKGLGSLGVHCGINKMPHPPLPVLLAKEAREGCEGLSWAWWAYDGVRDCIRRDGAGKKWPLETVVEQELLNAVDSLNMGEGHLASAIAGRVVKLEEWIYGR